MAQKHMLIDGAKGISLDQYPDDAWIDLSPNSTEFASSRKATEAIGNYYQFVAFLYRCVQLRSTALIRVPWAIVKGETDAWDSKTPVPPNDLMHLKDIRRFLRLTEAALCLSPEAFWFKERNRVRTLAVRWHAPTSVIPQWSETAGLTGFKRLLGNGKDKVFKVEDYVYFALPNPLHETIPSRPPAQAAMSAAGVLYNVDAFAAAFFARGAIRATLLTVEGNPPQGELLKLEAWWKRFFSGIRSAYETAAVRMGVTPVVVGEGMESLAENELTREKKEDIATALGIPHSLVMSDAANRSVAETDDLHFYDKTVVPSLEFIVEILNDQLLGPAGYRMELRQEEMSIFQEDEEQRSQSLQHLVSAGFDLDMAAEVLGYHLTDEQWARLKEKVKKQEEQADELRESMQQPQSQQQVQQPQDDDDERVPQAKATELARYRRWLKKRPNADPATFESDILTDADKAAEVAAITGFFTVMPNVWTGNNIPDPSASMAAWKAVLQLDPDDDEQEQKIRMGIEQDAEEGIATALEKQRRALIPANSPPTSVENVVQRVEATSGPVRDALRRALIASADLGVSVAVQQFENIGFGFDWTLVNTEARDWANRYSGELIRQINNTTRNQVRQAIGAWIDNGDPLPVLVRELAPTFGRRRASLIASTEVTNSYAEANRMAYERSGVVEEIEWRTAVDERVCPQCGPLHGTRTNVRNPDFGGHGLPSRHPGCRCWVVPVIED